MIANPPEATSLPAGLRERVLLASHDARPAGRSYPDVIEISPLEALRRSADALNGLLCALSEAQWQTPVIRYLTVQGLVGHLIGVERDTQRALEGDRAVSAVDHVESTAPIASQQRGRPPVRTRTEWREMVERTAALVESLDPGNVDTEIELHGMQLTARALLVVRAFELWTHDNDIRQAIGLPLSSPDPSTLRLMTDLAAQLLPLGADRIGWTDRVQLHLVLTGVGGGTWDIALGASPLKASPASTATTAVAIIADAVEFCRLVANRLAATELDVHVSGEADRAPAVLAAAAALALD